MTQKVIDEDVLVARAAACHIRDLRTPTPSLKHSRMLEFPVGKVWVELRSDEDETVGLYQYFPNSGQLRRQ